MLPDSISAKDPPGLGHRLSVSAALIFATAWVLRLLTSSRAPVLSRFRGDDKLNRREVSAISRGRPGRPQLARNALVPSDLDYRRFEFIKGPQKLNDARPQTIYSSRIQGCPGRNSLLLVHTTPRAGRRRS